MFALIGQLGRQALPSVAPTGLSLVQTANHRNFTVSWTAGSGNGGAGGCKLQFLKQGTTWTDLVTGLNCDASTSGLAENLPADGWNGGSAWASISVRLVSTGSSSQIASFASSLTCSVISGSTSSTPTIDEDCDNNWDNTTSVTAWYNNSSEHDEEYSRDGSPIGWTYCNGADLGTWGNYNSTYGPYTTQAQANSSCHAGYSCNNMYSSFDISATVTCSGGYASGTMTVYN